MSEALGLIVNAQEAQIAQLKEQVEELVEILGELSSRVTELELSERGSGVNVEDYSDEYSWNPRDAS